MQIFYLLIQLCKLYYLSEIILMHSWQNRTMFDNLSIVVSWFSEPGSGQCQWQRATKLRKLLIRIIPISAGMNSARDCSCSTLKVALYGEAMATASGADGIYYKKWDRTTRKYLWRQTQDGFWLGNTISKGENYWYIGPIKDKFKNGVSCFMTLPACSYSL